MIPKFSIQARQYDDALANAVTFNLSEVNEYLWLQIPVEFAEDFDIVSIERVFPSKVDLTHVYIRDNYSTWIKIPSENIIDYNVSQLFKVVFSNKLTGDNHSLFFAYAIQTEDIEKPYIYVEPKEN